MHDMLMWLASLRSQDNNTGSSTSSQRVALQQEQKPCVSIAGELSSDRAAAWGGGSPIMPPPMVPPVPTPMTRTHDEVLGWLRSDPIRSDP
jgi:hypothetical protein